MQRESSLRSSAAQPDTAVLDIDEKALDDIVWKLRGGHFFKLVRCGGTLRLQLQPKDESVQMTSFRYSAEKVDSPVEIEHEGKRYYTCLKVPVSGMTTLDEVFKQSADVWMDSFCVNIADVLQRTFESIHETGKSWEMRDKFQQTWKAEGLRHEWSLRKVLIDSMAELYVKNKTFVAASLADDDEYCLRGWILQESLYNEIVLKISAEPEVLDNDIAIIKDMQRAGGLLNGTANRLVRRRFLMGTIKSYEVEGGYVTLRGTVSPDMKDSILEMLRRIWWKVKFTKEEDRHEAMFGVLRAMGLVDEEEEYDFYDTLSGSTRVDLSTGSCRAFGSWVVLPELHFARHGEANSRPEALRKAVSALCEAEVIDDLRALLEDATAARCEAALQAPVNARQVEVSQSVDADKLKLTRSVRVLDEQGRGVSELLVRQGVTSNLIGWQCVGTRVIPLSAEHASGDSYLLWICWDVEEFNGRKTRQSDDLADIPALEPAQMAKRAAVVIQIEDRTDADFGSL